jgi:hypothetical protein
MAAVSCDAGRIRAPRRGLGGREWGSHLFAGAPVSLGVSSSDTSREGPPQHRRQFAGTGHAAEHCWAVTIVTRRYARRRFT